MGDIDISAPLTPFFFGGTCPDAHVWLYTHALARMHAKHRVSTAIFKWVSRLPRDLPVFTYSWTVHPCCSYIRNGNFRHATHSHICCSLQSTAVPCNWACDMATVTARVRIRSLDGGLDTWKYVGWVGVCFDTTKLSHSFIQNCCWIGLTLKVSRHQGWNTCINKKLSWCWQTRATHFEVSQGHQT